MSKNIRIIFIILSLIFIVFTWRIIKFYTDVNTAPVKDEPEAPTVSQISENYYSFGDNGFYGVKDRKGKIIIEASWNSIEKLGNECFLVSQYSPKGQRFGIIDTRENVIVPFIYTGIENFGNEFLCGKTENEKYVLFDYCGNVLINEEWDGIRKNYSGKSLETKGNYIQAEKQKDIYRIVYDESGKLVIRDILINRNILGEDRQIRIKNTSSFAGLGDTYRMYNELADKSIKYTEALFSGDSASVKELSWNDDYRELMLEELNLRGSRLTFVETPEPSVTENDDGTVTYRCVFSVEYVSPDDIQWDGTYTNTTGSLDIEILMKKKQDGKLAVYRVYASKSNSSGE
ncbi:MAG: WG repeat-containing protein [Oscillospiraceae bacterium]